MTLSDVFSKSKKYIDKEKSKEAKFNTICDICNERFVSSLPDNNVKVDTFNELIEQKLGKVEIEGFNKKTFYVNTYEVVWKLSYICPNCGYSSIIAYIKSGDIESKEELTCVENLCVRCFW